MISWNRKVFFITREVEASNGKGKEMKLRRGLHPDR
jgi:hypothetical protein